MDFRDANNPEPFTGLHQADEVLVAAERVHAQHFLRGFDHKVGTFINALSPVTGMTEVKRGQVQAQLDQLAKALTILSRNFGTGKRYNC